MTLTQPTFESVVGAGAMINWITVAPEHLDVYEDWYNFQHLPERVSTPGFLRARRFVADGRGDRASVDYLTLYETTDVDVLASPEYLRRLNNPTELTREVVPLFAEFRRAACRVTVVNGSGSSGRVVVMELDPGHDHAALRTALSENVFPELIAEHRLVAASLYEPDAAVGEAKKATAEGRSSTMQQQATSSVVIAELHSGVDADVVVADLAARTADAGVQVGQSRAAKRYELVYELRSATSTSIAHEEAS